MRESLEYGLHVVDVCGTLVRDDTTLGLLRYHFSRDGSRRGRARFLESVTRRRSLLWFGFAAAEKLTGRHLLKHVAVRLLAGDKVESLSESAVEYAEWLFSERRVLSVWKRLEEPLFGGRVVLASASLSPVVGALAEEMGVDYVASELEEKNGRLTGRYARDLTGCKEDALAERYGEGIRTGAERVFTDNFTDRPLVEKAHRSCIVLHSPSHRARWDGVDADFLGVDQ